MIFGWDFWMFDDFWMGLMMFGALPPGMGFLYDVMELRWVQQCQA